MYVVVKIGKNDEWEDGRFENLDQAKEAARECLRLSSDGDSVELRQYVDESEIDYNTFDFSEEAEEPTFIINTIRPAGGKSYKRYTWKEVLEWFSAPEDIEDIADLESWIEQDTGLACQYLIEEF